MSYKYQAKRENKKIPQSTAQMMRNENSREDARYNLNRPIFLLQMKQQFPNQVIQRGIDRYTGELTRSTRTDRMYNAGNYRWRSYQNLDFGSKRGKKSFSMQKFIEKTNSYEGGGDHTSVHHIIGHRVLQGFWDTIVNYYPDYWGQMTKDILTQIERVFGRAGNDVHNRDYQNQLMVTPGLARNQIDAEIDREQQLLERKAFHNEEIDLLGARPDNMDGIDDLINTAYSWMPGNLVVGAASNSRTDDPGEAGTFDEPALLAKGLKPEEEERYRQLHADMVAFNGSTTLHDQRKQYITERRRGELNVMPINIFEEEVKARRIIEDISLLLAGKPITNDTLWRIDGARFSAPDNVIEVRKKHVKS